MSGDGYDPEWESLYEKYLLADGREKLRILKESYASWKTRDLREARKLQIMIAVADSPAVNKFYIERVEKLEMDMSDNSDNSITSGRDTVGSSAGKGNWVTISNVTSFNEWVDNSKGAKVEVNKALKDCRAEIEKMKIDADEKELLVESFTKLALQLNSPNPSKGIVESLWAGVSTFVKGVKPFVDLAKLVGEQFGIYLPSPT